jgi:hypothetical protein
MTSPMMTIRVPRWLQVGAVAALITLASNASGAAAKDVPPWKDAAPGTQAFLGDDGGGVNTVTVCDTVDRFRDWLNSEHPPGCQTFQHDLPATIEVVIFDPIQDMVKWSPDPIGLPLVKVHIPSRNFVGYLQLLSLHPVIPGGTAIQFKKLGSETFELFAASKINSVKDDKGLDLGDQFSAKIIKYDPSKDDDWDFYVTVLDGKYAGHSGWMLSSGAIGDDGTPIDQFSQAVISKSP